MPRRGRLTYLCAGGAQLERAIGSNSLVSTTPSSSLEGGGAGSSRLRRIGLPVAILLVVALGVWRCAGGKGQDAPQYQTVVAETGDVIVRVSASGTLSAVVTVDVGSQVSGRIQSLYADFNSIVKKGQRVAKIDPALFEAAVAQSAANVSAARGNLRFKGPERLNNDLAAALELDPQTVCTELGMYQCTALVHTVSLGGVEPYGAGLYESTGTAVATPLPSVERVHIGGEGFRYEFFDGLRPLFRPDAVMVHSLASSEGAWVLLNEFALADSASIGPVHVGTELFPGTLRLEAVPDLGAGLAEVHVGGAIATEYLDDPGLTAERFYADPDGRRWWRSHDLVSFDAEVGAFRHAGRMDDVVKVRGKLASPSDVTAVLLEIDGVAGAITIPVVTEGATRLVAHVEIADESTVRLDDLRRALAARLPAHAVPSAIMRHERLPVTERGKVDRAALMDGPFAAW